jgi:hypothetical protein
MAAQESKGTYKTKSYTRRAQQNYTNSRDKVQFNIDKGEKTRWFAVGLDYNEIKRIIREEYKRRIGATDITPQQEPELQPEVIEQPEEQTTPEEKPEEKPFMPKPTQASINFFD